MNSFPLQKLNLSHISDVIALSNKLGWDYDAPELTTAFHSGSLFGHVHEGKVISTAAIFPYGNQLASLGMVMVNPNYRGLGLGKAVTQRCMRVADIIPIQLISTVEGKRLYEKLGFKVVDHVHKLVGHYDNKKESSINNTQNVELSSLSNSDHDLNQMIRLDSAATGVNRFKFLIARLRQSKRAIQLRHKNGKMIGYGLSIQLPDMLLIGPIVANDQESALALIHELAKETRGSIRIDLYSRHKQLVESLKDRHLREIRIAPVMINHAEKLSGYSQQLFAIASQAFG